MATLFLWANLIVFGTLTEMTRREYSRKSGNFRDMLLFGTTWQFVSGIIVLLLQASPWHLLWTLPISFILAFILHQKLTPISLKAAAQHLDPSDRKDFISFVETQADLRKHFADKGFDPGIYTYPGEAGNLQLSAQFCLFSQDFQDSGNWLSAMQCLRWALRFEPLNTTVWFALAELHLALDDRCASHWAKKFLDYKPTSQTPPIMRKLFEETMETDSEGIQEQRKRMRQIIQICKSNPEWHDTSDWVRPFGL